MNLKNVIFKRKKDYFGQHVAYFEAEFRGIIIFGHLQGKAVFPELSLLFPDERKVVLKHFNEICNEIAGRYYVQLSIKALTYNN